MKETPMEMKIRNKMLPGNLTRDGFLGDDPRELNEIIADDERLLNKIGITAEEIADRLEYFFDEAYNSFEEEIIIDKTYKIKILSVRGKILCPFSHPVGFPKGMITFTNLKYNEILKWTPLNIHMIREHHFFEGRNSTHRLDPEICKKLLF